MQRHHDWIVRAINDFSEKTSTKVEIKDQITSGKSGAFVAVVDCTGSYDGVFFLKISEKPSTHYRSEIERHKRAIDLRAFSGKVPNIIYHNQTLEYCLILMQIAGGSLIKLKPLLECINLYLSGIEALSNVLWDDTLEIKELTQASELLRNILDYQLDEKQGGRIYKHAEKYLLKDLEKAPYITCLDKVLPNPLYFISHNNPNDRQLRPLYGPLHGDCHAENIYVHAKPDASISDAWLIDLSFFRDSSPFFYDLAYFEFATLIKMFDGVGEERWIKFVGAILNSENDRDNLHSILHQNERAWADDIILGRLLIEEQIKSKHENRFDDLILQLNLSQIAVAISFLNKNKKEINKSGGLSKRQYRLAFLWACLHFDSFLKLAKCQFAEKKEQIPNLLSDLRFVEKPELEWQKFSVFDIDSFNILVLSQTTKENDEHLKDFPFSKWNLVVDLCSDKRDNSILNKSSRSFIQLWPSAEVPDLKILNRGAIWYYANSRSDISNAPIVNGPIEWRRKYHEKLDSLLRNISKNISPPIVNVLFLGENFDNIYVRLISESIDGAFGEALNSTIIATDNYIETSDIVKITCVELESAVSILKIYKTSEDESLGDVPTIPVRRDKEIHLEEIPADFLKRVEKDITVVHSLKAKQINRNRRFGIDFLRGMPIEWSELDKNVDVGRDSFETELSKKIEEELKKSSLSTVNLLHEPSAGGSTLGRRLAWQFHLKYPVITIDQLSEQTSSYIREIFRFTTLPVLVLAEAEVVTDSDRQLIFKQLWEENTRAVFLTVSRVYRERPGNFLKTQLNDSETKHFLDVFKNQLNDPVRKDKLDQLANNPKMLTQRNLFFFGLTAFDRNYLGLDKLINETMKLFSDKHKKLITCLSLTSLYSSEGFPIAEFSELEKRNGVALNELGPDNLFVIRTGEYVKISHQLIAEKYLESFSRDPNRWKADLSLYVDLLIDEIRTLKNFNSERVHRLIKVLFVTRDTESTLIYDIDSSVGGIQNASRRFSPLIQDIGNPEIARKILSRISNTWIESYHYSIHYVRHLLYETPRQIERALQRSEGIKIDPDAQNDPVVYHVVGMCYRIKMESMLDKAKEDKSSIEEILSEVIHLYDQAIENFSTSIKLSTLNEYGLVATIQTITIIIKSLIDISNFKNYETFIKRYQRNEFFDMISLGEESVSILKLVPSRNISIRAEKVCAQWDFVYGNVDSVLNQLNVISKKYEEPSIRRAICSTIKVKFKREWNRIPQGHIRNIIDMMEKNIVHQEVQISDLRNWIRAYRYLSTYDSQKAIERMLDWHSFMQGSAEPVFYLYILYLIKWLNSDKVTKAYAIEYLKWLRMCKENKSFGYSNWSYEWLAKEHAGFKMLHYHDIKEDPVELIRAGNCENKLCDYGLTRIEGTLIEYKGPQRATIDLGNNISVWFQPLDIVSKDDLGNTISVYVSFNYDGPRGWDPKVVK